MSRDLLKELRRHAGMGNKAQVKSILRDLIKQEPDDCFAVAELKRLRAGKELYSTLDYKGYRQILHEASIESLHRIMRRYPLTVAERMVKGKLRRLLGTINMLERRMHDVQQTGEAFFEYKRSLRRELNKRSMLAGGKASVLAGIPLAILIILGMSIWHMHNKAEQAAQAVEKAVAAEDWQRVVTLKDSANSGINRLLFPPMEATINKAESWMAHKMAIQREAHNIIDHLKGGRYNIETMPVAQRALMERYLRALPPELNDVHADWLHFCDQAKVEWLRQIPDILAQVRADLPPCPSWTGQQEDSVLIEQYYRELETLFKAHQDAVDAYHLDANLLKPLQAHIGWVKGVQKEIHCWQKATKNIAEAKDYNEYTKALQKLGTPQFYPPAVALSKAVQTLPSKEALLDGMRDPGRKIPLPLLHAMQRVLLEQKATFCKESPASAQQVELLNDLFTTRTLRTVLYRIRSAEGHTAYSTKPYSKNGDHYISFRRAELDPDFHIGQDTYLIWAANGASQQRIDPTGLTAAAGLERRSFFVEANLPDTLSRVINYTHKDCPALAKAYVYDTLIRILQMHAHPEIIGAAYSPSLRADIRSFTRLRRNLGILLCADCWLHPTQRAAAAEATLQAWFQERKGRNYAAEIKKNYANIAAVHPLYVGYVGLNGQAFLCQEFQKGDELWYFGEKGLCHELRSEIVYAQASPFTPIFVKVKDKKKKH